MSVYLLNPLYFYRGKITDRTKVLIRYENMKKDNNDSIRV